MKRIKKYSSRRSVKRRNLKRRSVKRRSLKRKSIKRRSLKRTRRKSKKNDNGLCFGKPCKKKVMPEVTPEVINIYSRSLNNPEESLVQNVETPRSVPANIPRPRTNASSRDDSSNYSAEFET